MVTPQFEEIPDPLLPSARLRKNVRGAASRILARFGRCAKRDTGVAGGQRPKLDYRGALSREPVGRVLLSYLAEPFHHPPEYSRGQDYSNWMMSLEVANALNSLGFVVDVINCDDYEFRPTSRYDVFVGMAANSRASARIRRWNDRRTAARILDRRQMTTIHRANRQLLEQVKEWISDES